MRGEGSRVKTHSSWVQQGLALGFVLGVRTRAGYLPRGSLGLLTWVYRTLCRDILGKDGVRGCGLAVVVVAVTNDCRMSNGASGVLETGKKGGCSRSASAGHMERVARSGGRAGGGNRRFPPSPVLMSGQQSLTS